MPSYSRGRFLSANRLMAYSILFVLLSGVVSPFVMKWVLGDGGFQRFGWKIDLADWEDTFANRGDQPLIHTDLESEENGRRYVSMWINSGQSLLFKDVPATDHTQFQCEAMVNSEWNPGAALPPVDFRVTIIDGAKSYIFKSTVMGARQVAGRWQQIVVDLAPYAGNKVTIEIAPVSNDSGIWTLWRNPRIGISH